MKLHDSTGSISPVIITVLIVIGVALGGWYLLNDKQNERSADPPATSQNQDAAQNPNNLPENPTAENDSETIQTRAKYAYEYYSSPGDFRAQDLETKGYFTAKFSTKEQNSEESLLVCSQLDPANTYTYGSPVLSGNRATLVVNIKNNEKTTEAKTEWVNEGGTWKIDEVTCPTT